MENNNLKNTLLDVAQNFDNMSDSEKAEVNDNVRKQFDNIIHGKPPKTEREKEIDKLAREELEREIIFYPCLLFLPPNGIETPTNPLTVLEFFPKNI